MDQNRALIIVDVQPTFCEGGALGVDGGNAVAERIADFVTGNSDEYAMIVTTQDWHINPGDHFSENPDFVDTWPPHGVAGTAEAELHEAIAALSVDASVKKGEYEAAYSGFEGHDADDRSLEDILREAEVDAVDVVGIAESHCVKETALDALRLGWPTRVLSDLTVPVSEGLGTAARDEMDEAGVEQLTSSEAFGFYDDSQAADEYDDYTDSQDSDSYDEDEQEDVYDADGDGKGDVGQYGSADGYGHDYPFGDEDSDDLDDEEDFSDLASTGLMGFFDQARQAPAAGDVDLDFDLDVDLDEDVDFSDDADEADFDFSDIDYKPGM